MKRMLAAIWMVSLLVGCGQPKIPSDWVVVDKPELVFTCALPSDLEVKLLPGGPGFVGGRLTATKGTTGKIVTAVTVTVHPSEPSADFTMATVIKTLGYQNQETSNFDTNVGRAQLTVGDITMASFRKAGICFVRSRNQGYLVSVMSSDRSLDMAPFVRSVAESLRPRK